MTLTVVLGLVLGLGVVLIVSPFAWPATGEARTRSRSAGGFLRQRLSQAGLPSVSLTAVGAVCVVGGVAIAALSFALVPVVVISLIAGVGALALPLAMIQWRVRSRRRAARVLWPDIVDHLVSAVRSGLALPDSVMTLAHTGPVTTRDAFSEFARDYRATGNFGLSIDALKDRLADPVADRILETLRMSREVGGSELTTVLRNLSSYLRQEAALRSEVEARQSWVVNAARLGVAAPWVILVLLATRPEAAAAYNTFGGGLLIVGGLLVTVIAYRLMLALGRFPQERRWFA
ncbi:type II secretion system F family protein [Glaciihabitans sp. INWT7]|uniref:type II secretion system F family protein n=1 Tax=Glaciihabitans sp. INWT7 TaxID=2596912 RepID=UPI0016278389|nr:type II secretion system F family protein [Glaciihabitans sp. INWT7]QNE46286.1 type II secretion system F family protein [Glaciihabitans sp. INWT7]